MSRPPGSPLDDLGLTPDPIDDRWTSDKLARAGWVYSGSRRCNRGCGEEVEFYLRETLKGKSWLILDAGSLEGHQCG